MSRGASPGASARSVTSAERAEVEPVVQAFCLPLGAVTTRYVDERCGKTYDAYQLSAGGELSQCAVLKKDAGEHRVYDRWLDGHPDLPVAQRLTSHEVGGVRWHLLEDVGDRDLQCLTLELAEEAGREVAEFHSAFWQESAQLSRELRDRLDKRRASHREVVAAEAPDAADALAELDCRSRLSPRTLCNGDYCR